MCWIKIDLDGQKIEKLLYKGSETIHDTLYFYGDTAILTFN
jgi:hypothetical protein